MWSRRCVNQSELGMKSHQCNESGRKKPKFWHSLPRKKFELSFEILRSQRIKNFKNNSFMWPRRCSNQSKLGMEYQQCNESVKQKVF